MVPLNPAQIFLSRSFAQRHCTFWPWLIDWSQYFPSVFLIQKRTPFLKSLLSVFKVLCLFGIWSWSWFMEIVFIVPWSESIVHKFPCAEWWMSFADEGAGNKAETQMAQSLTFSSHSTEQVYMHFYNFFLQFFEFWQKRKEGDVAPSPRETILSEWVGINWEKVLIQFNQMSFWSDSKGKKWKTISASS